MPIKKGEFEKYQAIHLTFLLLLKKNIQNKATIQIIDVQSITFITKKKVKINLS